MKLQFEPSLDYQRQAIDAVCDLFRGQEICRTEFTVTRDPDDPQLRIETASGVQRREAIVQDGDDLEQTTKRAIYANCRIGEIRLASGNQYMELRVPGGENYLKPGKSWGDVDPLAVQREMIRRTIKEHLDKEKRLRPQGIKVLSLFFIDEVARYRQYDADHNPVKGEYARIFEEEYRSSGSIRTTRRFLLKLTSLAPPKRCMTVISPSTRRVVGRTPRKTIRPIGTVPSARTI